MRPHAAWVSSPRTGSVYGARRRPPVSISCKAITTCETTADARGTQERGAALSGRGWWSSVPVRRAGGGPSYGERPRACRGAGLDGAGHGWWPRRAYEKATPGRSGGGPGRGGDVSASRARGGRGAGERAGRLGGRAVAAGVGVGAAATPGVGAATGSGAGVGAPRGVVPPPWFAHRAPPFTPSTDAAAPGPGLPRSRAAAGRSSAVLAPRHRRMGHDRFSRSHGRKGRPRPPDHSSPRRAPPSTRRPADAYGGAETVAGRRRGGGHGASGAQRRPAFGQGSGRSLHGGAGRVRTGFARPHRAPHPAVGSGAPGA